MSLSLVVETLVQCPSALSFLPYCVGSFKSQFSPDQMSLMAIFL